VFHDHNLAHTLLLELARTGSNYFQDTDPEFLQMYAVLEDFSSTLHAAGYPEIPASLTPRGMRRAVRRQIRQLLDSPVLNFIITINTMATNMTEEDIPVRLKECIETHANTLFGRVEEFGAGPSLISDGRWGIPSHDACI
jgi:hypothetical protein